MGAGANPGFFLGGGALLRNGITTWRGKQILKANMKRMAFSQGDAHPLDLPLEAYFQEGYLTLQEMKLHLQIFFLYRDCQVADWKNHKVACTTSKKPKAKKTHV